MHGRLSFNIWQSEHALWGTDRAEASITTHGMVRLVTSILVSMAETAQAKKGDHRPVTQHLGY